MSSTAKTGAGRALAPHGWLGLLLVGACWPLNWCLPGMRTHLLFFPLWLGFVLFVDALVLRRSGTSLLARSRAGIVLCFALSVPVWWLFELFNQRLKNWEYVGGAELGPLEYALLCSLSFSTVVPAIFECAELARGLRWIERLPSGPRVRLGPRARVAVFVSGALMLAAMLAWPRALYPLVWVSGVFLLEPVVLALGRRGITTDLERGDWRPWVSLWTASLVCGSFWEMWNSRSFPKWIYHVPGVGFAHLFEMPALGYLGYLPFAMELYLLGQLLLPERARPKL